MIKEIGGYFQLDKYRLNMLHENAIAFNSARNCLAYIIRKRNIKKLYIPKFLCSCISQICNREGVEIIYYTIGMDFLPKNIAIENQDWIYIVNYYGQLNNDDIFKLKKFYNNIIVDNVQAYFQKNIEGIDTIYTCRKFFGVTDGAFLYTDIEDDTNIPKDQSYDRMSFVLGRYERPASDFYGDYAKWENELGLEDIKHMSDLTYNLLHGIDYNFVKNVRNNNYNYLSNYFKEINKINLKNVDGAFMYPLYLENGSLVRKKLQERKIYISTLWPDVFEICSKQGLEYDMAQNILPLPIDQRYSVDEMKYMADSIIDIVQSYNYCTQHIR